MSFLLHPSTIAALLNAIIVVALSIRVIMKRPATGVAMAWLLFIAIIPLGGAFIYLLIGERRIGSLRARRIASFESS